LSRAAQHSHSRELTELSGRHGTIALVDTSPQRMPWASAGMVRDEPREDA
jgi:hypothetical protein